MKKITVFLVTLLLPLAAFPDVKLSLRPMIAPYQDALGYGVAIGLKSDISTFVPSMKPGLFTGLEFAFSAAAYSNLSFYDLSGGADIGYRFTFFNNLSVAPYVTLGAGYINFTDVSTNVNRVGFLTVPSLNVEYFITRNFSVGLEAGYRVLLVSLLTNAYNVSSVNIALSVSYTFPAGPAGQQTGPMTKEQSLAGDLAKIMKENKLQGSVEADAQNEIKMSLSDVLFELGSDKVDRANVDAIQSIAKRVREYTDVMVVVEGHSDDRGDEIYNALLSAKRAKNVADLFIAFGIGSTQVSYKGWGKEKPLVPNTSEANRAKNRRVEIRFRLGK